MRYTPPQWESGKAKAGLSHTKNLKRAGTMLGHTTGAAPQQGGSRAHAPTEKAQPLRGTKAREHQVTALKASRLHSGPTSAIRGWSGGPSP